MQFFTKPKGIAALCESLPAFLSLQTLDKVPWNSAKDKYHLK